MKAAATGDIYQTVTDSIIMQIEAGQTAEKFVLPWAGGLELPKNASTGKTYRGINIAILWASQQAQGFNSAIWGTYNQWAEKGAQVRKGEKGTRTVFWKVFDRNEEEATADTGDQDSEQLRVMARWSVLFNAAQVDGYVLPEREPRPGQARIIEQAEAFMKYTLADIRHGGTRAFYRPEQDFISLPDMNLFHDTPTSSATEAFYSTAFHELTHWTGHASRLNRILAGKNERSEYAKEELIAELGAAFTCAKLGIFSETRADHAQYIHSWLKALKNDKKFIFSAASHAQKAVDHLQSLQPIAPL